MGVLEIFTKQEGFWRLFRRQKSERGQSQSGWNGGEIIVKTTGSEIGDKEEVKETDEGTERRFSTYLFNPKKRQYVSTQHMRSFTLIELLVVISIIAILAAMLLPALKNARDMGKRAVCMGNLKQIGMAIFMYGDDYDGYYPIRAYDGVTTMTDPEMSFMKKMPGDGTVGTYNCLLWLLYPYVNKNTKVYICPSVNSRYNQTVINLGGNYGWTYGASPGFFPIIKTDGTLDPGWGVQPWPVKMGNERFKDRKIMVLDGVAGWSESFIGTYGGIHHKVHNNGTDCLFIDGHVEWLHGDLPNIFGDSGQRWFRPDLENL